ncbi:hypothetical protein [Microbacterium sp. A1-JK]|uniref:hypothetical protein n=1 Tax=Microbacterium sp. A1-JK TaxID=3177516 RepID=UPI0038843FE8
MTFILGIAMFLNSRRVAKQGDRKLTTDEQSVEDAREDVIAERRRIELERLYERVAILEADIEGLKNSRQKQQDTIESQADEIERTNDVLSNVRHIFSEFVKRVQDAWAEGRTMPALTPEELKLLEDTYQPPSRK